LTGVPRQVSPEAARRLAVRAQLLEGDRPTSVLETVRRLGYVQIDPISVVARTQLLTLFARLPQTFDPAELDRELWERRSLFEYFTHAASMVLSEDYGIHQVFMRRYGTTSPQSQRAAAWVQKNRRLRDAIMRRIRRDGPVRSRDFTDTSTRTWDSYGWTSGRNVSWMLDWLWTKGRILVAHRTGGDRWWDLAERVLPDDVRSQRLTERQATLAQVERMLRALGVATAKDIRWHLPRGRYPDLPRRLGELTRAGTVVPATVDGLDGWMHAEALADLEAMEAGDWAPRTTVLSPFDNLVCNRDRTERLFGFDYRIEIYVPKAKRRYGYYVLPVLHGDRFVARVDASYDRAERRLTVHANHLEPGTDTADARATGSAIEQLEAWLGAST
jgi:uncharacterized protein